MTALAGYKGAVYVTSSPSVSLGGTFGLTDSGDHTTWNTPSGQYTKRYWDKTSTFTVQTSTNGGSSWTTASAGTYTIQYVGGVVILNSALSGTPAVQITQGNYFPYSLVGDAYNWDITIAATMVDTTPFNLTGWHTQLPVIKGVQAKFAKFWVDGTFWSLLGDLLVLVLFIDNSSGPQTGQRYEAFGYIKQDMVKNDVKQVILEDMDIAIDGQMYYLAN